MLFGLLLSILATLVLANPAWPDSGSSALSSGSGGGSGGGSGLPVLPVSSSHGLGALAAALTQTGKPYQWGATGPFAWDCSALVQWAFRQVGVHLPRTTWEQARVGLSVPFLALSPGDVVVLNRDGSHVGIYAGLGQIFNAYDYGVPVGLSPLDEFDIFTIRRF